MDSNDLPDIKDGCLVIPTCRLGEAKKTVLRYLDNFFSFGHLLPILVFDSLDEEVGRKEFFSLENTKYPAGIFYIGQSEKEKFLAGLIGKVGHEKIIRKIFRSCYGGNRNFTLVYTLGAKMITVDDDVYPFGYFTPPQKLKKGEIAKGRYIEGKSNGYKEKKSDVAGAFFEVLGKSAGEINWLKGKYIEDSAMDLLTNLSKGELSENILKLVPGEVGDGQIIKQAQTFRTGSPDIDAKDYINEFFLDPNLILVNDLSKIYALSDFEPCVTDLNWRVDSGVTGLDNREGLPPFIPTALRFEDYIFRLWLQKKEVASAHINAVQNHKRSQKNRNPLASDYLNEEMATLMKHFLRKAIKQIDPLGVEFSQNFEIEEDDIIKINKEAEGLYNRAKEEVKKYPKFKEQFSDFANLLAKNFFGFKEKKFIGFIKKSLKEEFDLLRSTMELWPKILEAAKEMPKPKLKVN